MIVSDESLPVVEIKCCHSLDTGVDRKDEKFGGFVDPEDDLRALLEKVRDKLIDGCAKDLEELEKLADVSKPETAIVAGKMLHPLWFTICCCKLRL